ncbi:MAG TPA: hypothetical protein VFI53_13995 [Myxococcaceae bacterium]|nr:hypothetical protein [Myxococcaceae bacterium]
MGRLLDFFRRSVVETEPPAIAVDPDEGFVSLLLGLRVLARGSPARYRIEARDGGRPLGFDVALVGPWQGQEIAPGVEIRWGTVELSSMGEASDAFLDFLCARYGVEAAVRRMAPTLRLPAVSLSGDPGREGAALKLKLFFEPPSAAAASGAEDPDEDARQDEDVDPDQDEEDDRYGEVYLNLDPVSGRAGWNEKDEGYRLGVVLGLTGWSDP